MYSLEQLKSRVFVDNVLTETVAKVDSDGDLAMYCFKDTAANDEFARHCRGLVYRGDTLLVKTFGCTDDHVMSAEDTQLVLRLTAQPLKTCQLFEAHEGVLIRVYLDNGTWRISTHKKLDAFKSKWGGSSASYGDMFVAALDSLGYSLDTFLETLNSDFCYTFVVRNRADNRIVCDAPDTPTMYFSGCFPIYTKTMAAVTSVPSFETCVVKTAPRLEFANEDALYTYMQNLSWRQQQGVLVVTETDVYKILNVDYKYLHELRGNEPSLKFRYLEVRMDRGQRDAFIALYPEAQKDFDEYENNLFRVATRIKSAYIGRYANRNAEEHIPYEQFRVVKKCHKWHCENRAENRVNVDVVIDVLNTLLPVQLNRLLREFEELKSAVRVAA
jgi:hypothetical protein